MSRKVVFPFVVVLWLLLKCEPGRAEDNASSNASNAVAAVEAAAAAAVAASEVATPVATPVAAEVAPAEAPSSPVSAPGSNANPASTAGITSTSTSTSTPTSTSTLGIDPSELPIKYWGNSGSGKFHRPSCPFAKAMNSRHVVLFHFRHEAVEAGQQPCRYCLPPFVKRVDCVLLPKTAKTAGSDSDASVASVKMSGSGVTEANSSRW